MSGIELRGAKPSDERAVTELLAGAALPTEGLGDFFPGNYVVAVAGDGIVGALGIERYGAFGLLRSAVVSPSYRDAGLGARMTRERLAWCWRAGIVDVFLLTTTAARFFEAQGFARVERSEVPAEVQASPEFATICPSSAVVMRLGVSTYRGFAQYFRDLHRPTLVLPNAWDAASARLLVHAGARVIATASAGVSWSVGRADGGMTRAEAMSALARIVGAVRVPVSADIESGYDDVAATVRDVLAAGAVGINLEDSPGEGGQPLLRPEAHAARIRLARDTAGAIGADLVINARTDVFLAQVGAPAARLEQAVARANLYRAAGADCIFVPGVHDEATIAALVQRIDAPLNLVIRTSSPPIERLRELGVARVSAGPRIAEAAYAAALGAARELLDSGTYGAFDHDLGFDALQRLMS